MATYGELKAQISRDLNKDDLDSDGNAGIADSTIEYYIKSAIRFYSDKHFWFNETQVVIPTVASQATVDLPADFLDSQSLIRVEDSNIILRRPEHWLLALEAGITATQLSDSPQYYAIYDKKLLLFPVPNAVFDMRLRYTRELPELVDDLDTNEWITEGERLIRAKATSDIYAFRRHDPERASYFFQVADKELEQMLSRSNGFEATGFMITPTL